VSCTNFLSIVRNVTKFLGEGVVRDWQQLNYLVYGCGSRGCRVWMCVCVCVRERESGGEPGLKRAGSILSGWFVAAITVTSTL
jgi:hypothetical protein